jgi:tripartite-type tricarboxylate transporter receptor subunit TctC
MNRLLAFLALALFAACAAAQYPAKPIRLIVPFPAGGASDNAARTVGQALSKSLAQPVVVENKPGGNGAVAAQALVSAAADGYTLLWGTASMVALPLLQKNAPYQSMSELTAVAITGRFAFGLFVHASVPATSLGDLITFAKRNPDKLAFASGTLGEFMSTAEVMKVAGISMMRVPYKGGAQAMPDLVAGRVQVYVTPISLGLPHTKDGRLRILATFLNQRSAAAPGVPTVAEAGLSGVSVPPTWQAIFAPPRTSPEVVERLSREVASVLRDPELRAHFDRQAVDIESSTPQSLAALIRQEARSWEQFIRENGITPE